MPEIIPTRPWRGKPTPKIRLAVYTKSGFRCMHCHWKPDVPEGYNGRYALGGDGDYCPRRRRRKLRILEIDHIVSYLKGGRYVIDNLQALCNSCNARKGAL